MCGCFILLLSVLEVSLCLMDFSTSTSHLSMQSDENHMVRVQPTLHTDIEESLALHNVGTYGGHRRGAIEYP